MCNCNQKRALYSTKEDRTPKGMVKVKLVENNPMVVNGNITGRMYVFRNINDINWIDKRDTNVLKKTKDLQVVF